MAGLYIHIPFCTQKCIYCDFLSGTNLSLREQFINALIAEMDCYLDFFNEDKIRTIYFGGGTPSLLSVAELQRIYDAIAQRWDISAVEEFTIECNPDDLTEEYLLQLRSLPINRLSIGVQSFCDDELQWLNRRHTALEAIKAVERAKYVGFENITIDLMFALPVQTLKSLNYSIDKALELDVQHISAYSLMFEPDSKITKLMELDRLQPLDEDVSADMFDLLSNRLTEAGYEQYEISNYAKVGFESRHNSGYWHGMRYLGLGPSAHSFDGDKRWSNIAHTIKYNAQLGHMYDSRIVEILTDDERFNELVFTALRTKIGVDLLDLRSKFGDKRCDKLLMQAQKYIDNGKMHIGDGRLSLTHSGIYISDSIISDFMIV
jgi:oxygen-independent coproporphyrinogen-3 oxidase